jgi:hypothetical protein
MRALPTYSILLNHVSASYSLLATYDMRRILYLGACIGLRNLSTVRGKLHDKPEQAPPRDDLRAGSGGQDCD